MAAPGASLEALTKFQADEIEKIIESLQGIAAASTGTTTTAPQPPYVPAVTTGGEEAILWKQVITVNIPPQEVPQTRLSRTNGLSSGPTREYQATPSPNITIRHNFLINVQPEMPRKRLGSIPRHV